MYNNNNAGKYVCMGVFVFIIYSNSVFMNEYWEVSVCVSVLNKKKKKRKEKKGYLFKGGGG